MPWAAHPGVEPPDPTLELITYVLDPVLVPLGFAPGQVGVERPRAQVIFCRGEVDSVDGGCVDLVLDVEASPDWLIVDVRYWGFPRDRWHLPLDRDGDLADQLDSLARMLPAQLG